MKRLLCMISMVILSLSLMTSCGSDPPKSDDNSNITEKTLVELTVNYEVVNEKYCFVVYTKGAPEARGRYDLPKEAYDAAYANEVINLNNYPTVKEVRYSKHLGKVMFIKTEFYKKIPEDTAMLENSKRPIRIEKEIIK